jgi:hypothetical protein
VTPVFHLEVSQEFQAFLGKIQNLHLSLVDFEMVHFLPIQVRGQVQAQDQVILT